jgi:hypothetical protein
MPTNPANGRKCPPHAHGAALGESLQRGSALNDGCPTSWTYCCRLSPTQGGEVATSCKCEPGTCMWVIGDHSRHHEAEERTELEGLNCIEPTDKYRLLFAARYLKKCPLSNQRIKITEAPWREPYIEYSSFKVSTKSTRTFTPVQCLPESSQHIPNIPFR